MKKNRKVTSNANLRYIRMLTSELYFASYSGLCNNSSHSHLSDGINCNRQALY